MKIKVLKNHSYHGKRRRIGSTYKCPDKFARLLIAIKKAEEYTEVEPEPEPKTEPKPEPEPEKKPTPVRRKTTRKKATRKKTTSRRGTYKTRDMQSE